MLKVLLLTLLGATAALVFCLSFYPLMIVRGGSMWPTLADRQWVLLDRLVYRRSRPNYDDKVAFIPQGSATTVVKKVVLLPGDPLKFQGNSLFLPSRIIALSAEQRGRLADFTRVPKDSYFVLGDNLNDSFDSRDFGFVQLGAIAGRVRP